MIRYVLRCNLAGVILSAEVIGPGLSPAHLRVRGRQCWDWSGALNAAALATLGPDGGRVSSFATIDILLVDIVQAVRMSADAIAAVDRLPATDRP